MTPEIAVSSAAAAGLESVSDAASYLGAKIAASAVVLLLTWLTVRFSVRVLELGAERSARTRFLKKFVPMIRISAYALAVYAIVAWIFHPQRETLFAFFTASGVAIGFASQDILKNIFGGVVIVIDRPFQVGDKIRVGEHYGEVISVGLRTTRIVTSDDNTVSIPNAEIVNQSVSNANSGALTCQVVTRFRVSADADIPRAKRLAFEAAASSPFVNLARPIVVLVVDKPADDGLRQAELRVKAYVVDPRFEFKFQSDATERFLAAFAGR